MLEIVKKATSAYLVLLTILFVIGYLGYFQYYNIDITSYLSVEDLGLFFSKWVIGITILLFLTIFFIIKIFTLPTNSSKTIGNTLIKAQALWIVPMIISILFIVLVYGNISILLVSIPLLCFIIAFFLTLANKVQSVLTKPFDIEKQYDNIVFIIVSIIIVSSLFFLAGHFFAYKKIGNNNFIIELENNSIINTQINTNLTLIGKTSNYIFIYDSKEQTTTVYPIDRIKYLKYLK